MEIINQVQHQQPRDRKRAVVRSPSFVSATFPGVTLFGGSAEMISNGIRSNRTCTIQISNHLRVPLTDPQFYCFNGGPYYPLPAVIQPGTREACIFFKDPNSPLGVIGVVTYQLGDSPNRLAVMFSVPYNQLEFSNHFGLAMLDEFESPCEIRNGALLFKQMYQEANFYYGTDRNHTPANDGVPMCIYDDEYLTRGTMSDRGKAIIKLNVTSALHT